MKKPGLFIICALSFLAGSAAAQQIVVLERTDVRILDSGGQGTLPGSPGSPTDDPEKAAFLQAVQADLARHAPFDDELTLVNPPAWGRVVSPETTGKVRIRRAFDHGFVFHLGLDHLLPNHRYILTLNGNPQRAGNGFLADPVPGNPKERYYDFYVAMTDANGGYDADFGVFLHPGDYDIRFYVKDTEDFKIVLYHDFFKMTVL
jgi:hypothetical protein